MTPYFKLRTKIFCNKGIKGDTSYSKKFFECFARTSFERFASQKNYDPNIQIIDFIFYKLMKQEINMFI